MLSVACAVTHGRTHVFIHVSDTCRRIPTRPDGLLHGWSSCVATHGSPAMLQLQIRRHLVLLHVKLHVLLPCMVTPRVFVDTQILIWLPPRPDPLDQATSSFSVGLRDF
ncbi:unnamed protein product [Brassica oleracea]